MAKGISGVTLFGFNEDKDITDIVEVLPQRTRNEVLMDIPVSFIRPDPLQPRKYYTEEDLNGLELRIKATNGRITKPIDVKPDPDNDDKYIIEDGEMRWRIYSERLHKDVIPARVFTGNQDLSRSEIKKRQLMANIGNIEMSPVDIALALEEWRTDVEDGQPHHTRGDIATLMGWSATKVSRVMSIIKVPADIQQSIKASNVTNINTLNSMVRVAKKDPSLFESKMTEFESPEFSDNPELFWAEAMAPAQEVVTPEKRDTDQEALQEVRGGGNQRGSGVDTGSCSQPKGKKEQAKNSVATPLHDFDIEIGDKGAVLQLFYQSGTEILSTKYALTLDQIESLKQALQDDE